MSHYYYPTMPVDKSTIKTSILIHPDFLADPVAYIRKHELQIRSTKPTSGRRAGRITQNINLNVLAYKGINVELSIITGEALADVTIRFNPGKCLHGHNSRTLLLDEFLHALSLMANSLKPLLLDQGDWVDLIPGLRRGGFAYWSYLEVLLQLRDADGTLLAGFRHLRHPNITTPSRHWPGSIKVGPDRGKLRLSIYLKAVEQHARGNLSESELSDTKDILRLEARMKDEKLVLYYGNDRNVEVINGKPRLVRFYPEDLVRGHRTCFNEVQGVYNRGVMPQEAGHRQQLANIGRLIARVANDRRSTHTQTFPKLLTLVRYYMGAPDDTVRKIRRAGLDELSCLSSISSDELLTDATYKEQLGFASERLEKLICHESDNIFVHPLVTAAYRPSGQPFHPHVQLPAYHR